MNNEQTTIYISHADFEKWKQFQKNYALFSVLLANGVFDVVFGKVILNFSNNDLKNVTKEEVVWHKGS